MRMLALRVSAFLLLLCLALPQAATAASVEANRVTVTGTTAGITALHLSEVQVFEQGTATNVAASAAGATATASSTGWGTDPSWAIDGNTDGAFGSNSIWHDQDGQAGDPLNTDVFTVTFAEAKTIDLFQIWGRSDCCTERDDSLLVQFYNGDALVGQNASGITVGSDTGRVSITAIPEPSTIVMLAGAALVGLLRRRKA